MQKHIFRLQFSLNHFTFCWLARDCPQISLLPSNQFPQGFIDLCDANAVQNAVVGGGVEDLIKGLCNGFCSYTNSLCSGQGIAK